MKYDALTLDTQTVQQQGFRFDTGLLAKIKQFVDVPTEVVISRIVLNEIHKHLTQKTLEAQINLERAVRVAQDFGLPSAEQEVGQGDVNAKEVAAARLSKFLNEIGADVIELDNVPLRDVFDRFYKGVPPFSQAKKNEFPDAAALMSLEKWAEANGKTILAVSADKDWEEYAKTSLRIDVVNDIATALAELQEHAGRAREVVGGLLNTIETGEDGALHQRFEGLLSAEISSYTLQAEASSFYRVEDAEADIAYRSFRLSEAVEADDFTVVQAGPLRLAVRVPVEIAVTASASFSLYMYDSVDREEVGMGYASAQRDEDLLCSILVTFSRPNESSKFGVESVEVIDIPHTLDFGEVEPDYFRDGYEFLQ